MSAGEVSSKHLGSEATPILGGRPHPSWERSHTHLGSEATPILGVKPHPSWKRSHTHLGSEATPNEPNGLLESLDVLIVFPSVVGIGAVRPNHVFVDLLNHRELKPLIIRLMPAGKQESQRAQTLDHSARDCREARQIQWTREAGTVCLYCFHES